MSRHHCLLDASALVARYCEGELGREIIQRLFSIHQKSPARVHLSVIDIAIPEVVGVFYKLASEGTITARQLGDLRTDFIEDLRAARIGIHTINGQDVRATDEVAEAAVCVGPPRTGAFIGAVDKLLLAVALRLKRDYGNCWLFTRDGHMLRVAKQLRIGARNSAKIAKLPWEPSVPKA